MTPFQRLGLYTASAVVAGTIAWVADVVSLWVGVASLAGGAILALISTFEVRQEPATAETPAEEGEELAARRREVLRRRTREEIVESAEQAHRRDEDDLGDGLGP